MWLILVSLLLFFWCVLRKQRRIERAQAAVREQERRDNELIRLATIQFALQENERRERMLQDLLAKNREQQDALGRIERQIDDALRQQDDEILNTSLDADADEQVQYLNQHYAENKEDDGA